LYAQLDKIPSVGDTITFEGWKFTVLSTRGRRITKVRVKRDDSQYNASTRQVEGRSGPLSLPPPREHEVSINQDWGKTASEQPSNSEAQRSAFKSHEFRGA